MSVPLVPDAPPKGPPGTGVDAPVPAGAAIEPSLLIAFFFFFFFVAALMSSAFADTCVAEVLLSDEDAAMPLTEEAIRKAAAAVRMVTLFVTFSSLG